MNVELQIPPLSGPVILLPSLIQGSIPLRATAGSFFQILTFGSSPLGQWSPMASVLGPFPQLIVSSLLSSHSYNSLFRGFFPVKQLYIRSFPSRSGGGSCRSSWFFPRSFPYFSPNTMSSLSQSLLEDVNFAVSPSYGASRRVGEF